MTPEENVKNWEELGKQMQNIGCALTIATICGGIIFMVIMLLLSLIIGVFTE